MDVKRFLMFFFILVTFFTFLTFCFIFQTFFIKKRWQSSEQQAD